MIAFNTKNLLYILLILTIIFIVIKFVKPYVSKKFIENYQEINKPFFPRIKKIKISKNGGYKDINMSGINLQNSKNEFIINWFNEESLYNTTLFPGTTGISIFDNNMDNLVAKPHPISFHTTTNNNEPNGPYVEIETSSLNALNDLKFINLVPRSGCCQDRINNLNIHLFYYDENNNEQEYIIKHEYINDKNNLKYRQIEIDRNLKNNDKMQDITEILDFKVAQNNTSGVDSNINKAQSIELNKLLNKVPDLFKDIFTLFGGIYMNGV